MKSVHFNRRSGNNFNFSVGLKIQGKKFKKHECRFKLVYMVENFARQRYVGKGGHQHNMYEFLRGRSIENNYKSRAGLQQGVELSPKC